MIRFRYAFRDLIGQVRENRGAIGVGGRCLYAIKFEWQPGDRSVIELPGVEIEDLHQSMRGKDPFIDDHENFSFSLKIITGHRVLTRCPVVFTNLSL